MTALVLSRNSGTYAYEAYVSISNAEIDTHITDFDRMYLATIMITLTNVAIYATVENVKK